MKTMTKISKTVKIMFFYFLVCVSLCSVTHAVQSNNETATTAPNANTNHAAQTPKGGFDFQSLVSQISKILPSSGGGSTKQAAQALQYLKFLFIGEDPQNIPGEDCLDGITDVLQGILSGEQWALRMIDAIGKPESGVLDGNLKWLGSYDECINIGAAVNKSGTITYPWKGQYCKAEFKLDKIAKQLGYGIPDFGTGPPSLFVGICMPNTCTDRDINILLYSVFGLLQQNASLVSPSVRCQKQSLEYDTKAIVALAISSIFAAIMVIATLYDVILNHFMSKQPAVTLNYVTEKVSAYVITNGTDSVQAKGDMMVNGDTHKEKLEQMDLEKAQEKAENKPGKVGQALLAFSVYTNGAKILNTDQPKGTLTAVNGIRFISMTWVILGHVYGFHAGSTQNMGSFYLDFLKRFLSQAILNATFSVDTFFVLSGLLVSYLSLKAMKKCEGAKKFQWGMFYFHRYWRLTPPYMLFMMLYTCLVKYLYNGPLYQQTDIDEKCGDYWWRNILYINNLFPSSELCMGWSWYLANDMQFYILSPLMLIPLYYSPILGALLCLAMLAVCCVSTGIISYENQLPPNLMFDRTSNSFDKIYEKPWTRIGAYAVGVFAGYILYRTNCKIKIPKIVNLFGWLVAAAVAMAVLYGLYDESGFPHLSNTTSSVYNALSRVAWGIAICWVIVACATGNGGFVNTLLSWKAFIPLSRLTYCAYLVHPVILYFNIFSERKLLYFSDVEGIMLFCAYLVLSYAVAFVVSLAFESPMMGLEKVFLGRGKKS